MAMPSALPEDNDGVHYERVDDLTVYVYIDGPGDSTIRPSHPSVIARNERDREVIAEMNARIWREQEEINARKNLQAKAEAPKQP